MGTKTLLYFVVYIYDVPDIWEPFHNVTCREWFHGIQGAEVTKDNEHAQSVLEYG